MLVCPVCGESKPASEMHKRSRAGGLVQANVRRCKACSRASFDRRYADPEKRAAMQSAGRSWKSANLGQHAALARAYRRRHPEKIVAQNRLNYAVRTGRVQRQPCEACGQAERVHAHHQSYRPEDWLNVRWLCFACHAREHTQANSRHQENSDDHQLCL